MRNCAISSAVFSRRREVWSEWNLLTSLRRQAVIISVVYLLFVASVCRAVMERDQSTTLLSVSR